MNDSLAVNRPVATKAGLMTDAIKSDNGIGPRPRRNWWIAAFLVALLAFEVAREIAVLESVDTAKPGTSFILYRNNYGVRAQGSWKRIDGGGSLVPGATTIDCDRQSGRCLEANVSMNEKYVYAPNLEWFTARFASDAVSYENDSPICARYSVRLDLKLQKVFAVRERKENPSNPDCAGLERRIEMQLADGYEVNTNTFEGHFVPIFSVLAALLGQT
jgi:hypothetical protein